MEVFLFILSFMSGGVILTVAYTTYLTNSTKTKQDKLAFLQDQLLEVQKQQFKEDRKSTRLNSSHLVISYAVFCLKKKKRTKKQKKMP